MKSGSPSAAVDDANQDGSSHEESSAFNEPEQDLMPHGRIPKRTRTSLSMAAVVIGDIQVLSDSDDAHGSPMPLVMMYIYYSAPLELNLMEAQEKVEESNREEASLIDIILEEREQRNEVEAGLRERLREASNIISELVEKLIKYINLVWWCRAGIHLEESFAKVKKYGLPMLLTQDEGVKSFIANLTAQLTEWREFGKLVVLVIMSKATGEVIERWNFSIETDSEVVEKGVSREKSDKEIMREIQAIMRQIALSITHLPCLDDSCKLLNPVVFFAEVVVLYIAVPFTWIESDPKLIANPQMVKLHLFDTKIHKVDSDTLVSYKNDEWDENFKERNRRSEGGISGIVDKNKSSRKISGNVSNAAGNSEGERSEAILGKSSQLKNVAKGKNVGAGVPPNAMKMSGSRFDILSEGMDELMVEGESHMGNKSDEGVKHNGKTVLKEITNQKIH
ncbi:hypothetical protein EZV62_011007 [Acer yangbiense]|uniref:HORMA domain-containing protein n=1 Tax=Acer yangbiense TaxID=1000413 RepID=A0A5C7I3B7_9ROSI|nr:hypothetical protein EZV62_011007 [Acer yangbiense]